MNTKHLMAALVATGILFLLVVGLGASDATDPEVPVSGRRDDGDTTVGEAGIPLEYTVTIGPISFIPDSMDESSLSNEPGFVLPELISPTEFEMVIWVDPDTFEIGGTSGSNDAPGVYVGSSSSGVFQEALSNAISAAAADLPCCDRMLEWKIVEIAGTWGCTSSA